MIRRNRAEFDTATKRAALHRSQGICECHRVPQLMALLNNRPCGCALTTGNTEYDHVIADALRPDNSLDNAAVLTRTCHKLKSDQHDIPVIAEAKRRFDRHYGIRSTPREVLAGTFASGVKLGFDRVPIDRITGKPWHQRDKLIVPSWNGIIVGSVKLVPVPLIGSDPT